MKRMFTFGKVDFYNCGIKRDLVSIEVRLEDTDKGPVLHMSGSIGNYCAGQCYDEIEEVCQPKEGSLLKELLGYWRKYHLNDMHAGTPAQEALLKANVDEHHWDYKKECAFLDEHNLLIDNGYRYGTAWLYEAIPEEVLKRIVDLTTHEF